MLCTQVSRFVSGLLPQQDPGTANRQALSGLMYGAGQNTSPTIWVMIGNNDYLRVGTLTQRTATMMT